MKLLMLVLFLTLLSSQAGATAYLECHDCSEAAYRDTARRHQPVNLAPDSYEVYVADILRGQLRRYRVTEEYEAGLRYRLLKQLVPAPAEQIRFDAYLAARNALMQELGALDFTVAIPPGHFVTSAYDLWGNSRNRLLVQEFINARLSFVERLMTDLFATGSFLLNRSVSHLLLKVTFPDGSVAYFQLTGKMEDFVWEYLEGRSLDAGGNQIPDRLQHFDNYSGIFHADSVQKFLMRASLYGIPIVNGGAVAGPVTVVCIRDANGGYTCFVNAIH